MIIDIKNFDLKSTLLSGQCFRVYEESDNSFTIVLFDRVINVKYSNKGLLVKSNNYDNLENVIKNYFDTNRDYEKINKKLSIDKVMKECINKCNGYRILNQNSFEMCISYIISQNNNVKRISSSIEKLCENRGKRVIFNDKEYYLFPSLEELKDITLEELRSYGVGFRDKYIMDFINNYNTLENIDKLPTKEAIETLMRIKGIGLKVASCILLFGYNRLDVFPIDTWVRKFMSNKYGVKNSEKDIEKFAIEKFGKYSGLSIQYMFNSERNTN